MVDGIKVIEQGIKQVLTSFNEYVSGCNIIDKHTVDTLISLGELCEKFNSLSNNLGCISAAKSASHPKTNLRTE